MRPSLGISKQITPKLGASNKSHLYGDFLHAGEPSK